jgi:hypothetical protein
MHLHVMPSVSRATVAASAEAIYNMGYFLIIAIIFFFGYYLSLKVHPSTKCQGCDGRGGQYHKAFDDGYRKCGKCDGTGRVQRLGTRLFRRGH